jgi:ParB/RepB/Spo0J family partition protein
MDLREIPVQELTIHPSKANWIRASHVNRLVDSIASEGLLDPLLVTSSPDGYLVLSGAHRLHAARQLGLPCVPCIILDPKSGDVEVIFAVDTLQKAANPLQEGQLLKSLLGLGYSQQMLAAMVHKSPSWVQHRLALVSSLVPEVQQQVAEGSLSARKAQDIARLPALVQARFAWQVQSQSLSAKEVDKLVALYNRPSTSEELRHCILTTPKLALQAAVRGAGRNPTVRAACHQLDVLKQHLLDVITYLEGKELGEGGHKEIRVRLEECETMFGQLESLFPAARRRSPKEVPPDPAHPRGTSLHCRVLPEGKLVQDNNLSVPEEVQSTRPERAPSQATGGCRAEQDFDRGTDRVVVGC